MDATRLLWILLIVLGVQALVWTPIILRMRHSAERIREEARRADERILVGPERANYQGWVKRFGMARTIGVLALTDCRVLFGRPFGRDIVIPLTEIANTGDTAVCGCLRHTSGHYLVLNLRDGSEVVFWLGRNKRWLEALRNLLSGTEAPR